LFAAAFALILLPACSGSPPPPGDTTLPPLSTSTPAELSAPTEELPVEAAPADTPAPIEPPVATPTAAVPEAATEPAAAATVALPAGAPADAQPLEIVGSGFGVGRFGAGWGLVVHNPNTTYALVGSRYTLTARDADGNTLSSEEGSLPLLLPGQRLGVGGALQVDDEEAVAALEVTVQMGEFVAGATSSLITAENVVYTAGNFSDEVSGTLVNPFATEIAGVRVAAVAFDAADNIIGGGTTILAALPAQGRAAVTVPVTVGGEPARVELFAVLEELPE
jgi:hypothetical protein